MMVAHGLGLGPGAGWMRCLIRAGSIGLLLGGCGATSHAFRLNPEQEPEQYRVTCKQRFHFCESEARKQCEGEYQELSRFSNRPEQTLVKDSELSSTGPAKGHGNWEGELTIECGRALPPLRLQRNPEAAPAVEPSEKAPAGETLRPEPAPHGSAATSPERVCVPGVTQACLGPGACKGAQACLETGQGFGACDCGPPKAEATDDVKAPYTSSTSATPAVTPPTP